MPCAGFSCLNINHFCTYVRGWAHCALEEADFVESWHFCSKVVSIPSQALGVKFPWVWFHFHACVSLNLVATTLTASAQWSRPSGDSVKRRLSVWCDKPHHFFSSLYSFIWSGARRWRAELIGSVPSVCIFTDLPLQRECGKSADWGTDAAGTWEQIRSGWEGGCSWNGS